MKPVIIIVIAFVFTLCLIPCYESAYAYTNQHKVSISSDEVEFGSAKIRIDYNVIIDVDRPSSVDPGDSFTVTVYPRSGTVTYNVEVLGETYSVPQNINLGDERTFSLITGIDGYVSTSASSFVNISGPVGNTQQTLQWDYPTSQTIRSSVNDNVDRSGDILVRIPIKINIDAGLNLNLLGIKQNLGEKNLGTFSAYPVIEEKISIDRPAISSESYTSTTLTEVVFLIIILLIVIAIVTSVAVVVKRRKN